jgi:hypothetical protein
MRSIIILFFLVNSLYLFGQNTDEISVLQIKTTPHHHHHTWNIAQNNSSTMEILLSSMFKFYKFFISSQDSQSCSFYPSCSVYAVETIKKQGFFIGILDTFDRLTRCNGLSPENYEIDYKQTLLIDPVRNSQYHEL